MESHSTRQTSWNRNFDPHSFATALTATGGATVHGDRGVLRVALQPRSMHSTRDEVSPTHWLLPLDNPAVVRLSANLPGQLLWLSPRPPQALAGLLVSDFAGACWEEQLAVLRIDGEMEAYEFPVGHPAIGSLHTLADIIARRWSGHSYLEVHAALFKSSVAEEPAADWDGSHKNQELAVA